VSDNHDIPSERADPAADAAGPEPVRLAIVSRSREAVDALWSAIDEKSRSRNRSARIHADRSDADAIVYLLEEEDLASDDAAKSYEMQLIRDAAASKIVVEPGTIADAVVRARLEGLRDRIGAHAEKIVWMAAKPPGEDEAGQRASPDNVVHLQARRIERILKGRPKPAPRERRERTRTPRGDLDARREARAKRGEQRRSANDANESRKARSPEAGERRKRRASPESGAPRDKPPPRDRRAAQPEGGLDRPAKGAGVPLPTVSIAIRGMDDLAKAELMTSLKNAFRESGARAIEARPQSRPHIAIHAFGDDPFDVANVGPSAQSLLQDKAGLRMFLGRTPAAVQNAGADDQAIARMALLCRGAFIDLEAQFRRLRAESPQDPKPRAAEPDLTAALVVREAINRRIRKLPLRAQLVSAPDLEDAHALAARPSGLLSCLSWSALSPPRLLHAAFSATQMEEFANSRIATSKDGVQVPAAPIDWQASMEERAASRLFGLGFLLAPLSYWYSKASERKSEGIAKVDAMLKERGVTASALLESAGRIIRDFSEKVPRHADSPAWREDAVSSRVRVLLLHTLCCRLAARRRIKFDEAVCGAIFRTLVDHLEFLRCDLPYQPASIEGVERDCLLAGAGLGLQQTNYGNVLLRDSLHRLKKLQLDVGLSGDGVWRGAPFATHCAVLSSLTTLLGDLATAGSDSIEPIAEAARRMTLFVDALLKSNGEPLPIDAGRSRSFASTLAGARQVLALVGARPAKGKPAKRTTTNRITDTYVFRDAQFFVSHSTPKVTPDSSQLAFHADPGSATRNDPGGLKLAFAHGPTDLLLGTVPRSKTLSGGGFRNFDPALRNGYRVGAVDVREKVLGRAAIVKSWRGPGWAAAKGIESVGGGVGVARIVIHLKQHHGLVIVDSFAGDAGGERDLEQFWHVAPGLAAVASSEKPLLFSAADGALLGVAFDDRPETQVAIDVDTLSSCLRRRMRAGAGTVATLFQRMDAAVPLSVSFQRDTPDDWTVAVVGAGLAARISLSSNDLRLDQELPPPGTT
jgi:hypothetical protein